ncbi:hypothetical protein [Streptomyces sp. NPDC001530]|uniref:terpene synthase family protein n=1 Tax=Streptomyces sp. NPDC001530 TaxID=3364582 RepID=UPI003687EAFB
MTGRLDDLDVLDTRPDPGHILYALPFRDATDHQILDVLAINWADGQGLLEDPGARERLSGARVGDLIARSYPGLRTDRAATLAGWFAWLFVIDDYHDRSEDLARNDQEERTRLSRGLAHLWHGVAPRQSSWWRTRFLSHVGDFLTAFRYEDINRRKGCVPSLGAYMQLRRASGGITPCLDLLEYATGLEVPPALHDTGMLRTMFDNAADVVVWVNDVVSLKKELAMGETNNGVLVVQRELDLSLQEAVRHVYGRVARDIREFLEAERELRRACAYGAEVSDGERAALLSLIIGMKAWMRGNLDWSTRAERYANP